MFDWSTMRPDMTAIMNPTWARWFDTIKQNTGGLNIGGDVGLGPTGVPRPTTTSTPQAGQTPLAAPAGRRFFTSGGRGMSTLDQDNARKVGSNLGVSLQNLHQLYQSKRKV